MSSVDARLFALDAHTGTLCPNFGEDGYVDLKKGMGPTENSKRYHPTSLPVVMGHLTVVGGWVRDIVAGEPSGAVRAFDVLSGSLVWAWDVGAPEGTDTAAADHQFALETPNVWTVPTYDKELNLVYLPTGNGPPDYWGGDRNQVKEKFGTAIVAVDASTGKAKWVFQTVHHDVWDYDLPSQPVLYEMKNAQGTKTPVLIQTTKTGQIFVLDRRTGQPVTEVQERAVPTSPAAEGEHLMDIPTQRINDAAKTIHLRMNLSPVFSTSKQLLGFTRSYRDETETRQAWRDINALEEFQEGQIVVDGIDMLDPKTDINHARQRIGMVLRDVRTAEDAAAAPAPLRAAPRPGGALPPRVLDQRQRVAGG